MRNQAQALLKRSCTLGKLVDTKVKRITLICTGKNSISISYVVTVDWLYSLLNKSCRYLKISLNIILFTNNWHFDTYRKTISKGADEPAFCLGASNVILRPRFCAVSSEAFCSHTRHIVVDMIGSKTKHKTALNRQFLHACFSEK